jgi:mannose/cellobiose epimerase-like protein (N-acyl-D-glucosamine 2-epimerase family)
MRHDDPAGSRGRLLAALRLQYPDVLAERGFRLLDPATGDRYTGARRHLVATCRATANFAVGAVADGPAWCREAAAHGLAFLREGHAAGDGYHLVVDDAGVPVDRTRSAYGHAFVLLAFARATAAGVDGAAAGLEQTAGLLKERFRESNGLLRSDCDADWSELEAYRGQNANMHACEAYLAAYEATGDRRFLERAATVARRLVCDLAAETDGLVWEHYTDDWSHDLAYNADRPRHRFRPPGYQPGHHAEWARLLALLDRHADDAVRSPAEGWYERAADLFGSAVDLGWLGDGFAYTVGRDGSVRAADRYGWAVAEAVGAAAALTERARANDDPDGATRFRAWHARLLDVAGRFRGPAGLWYERYRADGDDTPVPPEPPGVEPDYHPLGAWFEGWRSFRAR